MKQMFPTLCILAASTAYFFSSCKTTSPDTSVVKAWALQGNQEAARVFIIETIAKLPGVQKDDPVVLEFATTLQNTKTSQTESPEYVLEEYWKRSQTKIDPEQPSDIENYIVQEFMTHTNYIESQETSVKLQILSDNRSDNTSPKAVQ